LSSKFKVKFGDQIINISSNAWVTLFTVPIGATAHQFCYHGTVYCFNLTLYHENDASSNEIDFDIEDAETKLYSLIKSPQILMDVL
jgi:hypothetical protein